MTNTLVVYSDYVCPFCYLGRVSLRRYEESREDQLDLEWRPFDLRSGKRRPDGSIDTDVDDGKDDEYYNQARENVRRLQERYDVDMAQEIRRDVDSWSTQQASLYVRETHPETWRIFDEALLAALWEDGRDVGDVDVIAAVAAEVGLDPDPVREAVADDAWADRLSDAFTEASHAGVSGVPTWVFDGHAASGAVPPEHLRRLVEGS